MAISRYIIVIGNRYNIICKIKCLDRYFYNFFKCKNYLDYSNWVTHAKDFNKKISMAIKEYHDRGESTAEIQLH